MNKNHDEITIVPMNESEESCGQGSKTPGAYIPVNENEMASGSGNGTAKADSTDAEASEAFLPMSGEAEA